EVAIAGRRTAFARLELVGIHRQAHAAACFPPLETGFTEDAIEAFLFGLFFYKAAPRNHHRIDRARNAMATHDGGCFAQIADAPVGARADEDAVDLHFGQ